MITWQPRREHDLEMSAETNWSLKERAGQRWARYSVHNIDRAVCGGMLDGIVPEPGIFCLESETKFPSYRL